MTSAFDISRLRMRRAAFSLLELTITTVGIFVLLGILLTAADQARDAYGTARSHSEEFRESRRAFDSMTRRLGQATLNAYWGYDDPTQPNFYARQSELHFSCGPASLLLPTSRDHSGHALFFQAPLGYAGEDAGALGNANYNHLDDLLNCWGFYVEYGSDLPLRPSYLASDTNRNPERKRFRLMEYRLPSERMPLYFTSNPTGANKKPDINYMTNRDDIGDWYRDDALRLPSSRPIAENVIAMVYSPRAPGTYEELGSTKDDFFLAPDYQFDSRRFQWQPTTPIAKITRHALPPVVRVTCVAVDEPSFIRFESIHGTAGATALQAFINGLFQNVGTSDGNGIDEQYEADTEALETELTRLGLNYKIFVSDVPLRAAKWVTERNF